jgi:hypothetical protein
VSVRSIDLVIVGVLLLFVAAVPRGWQGRRFSRFLPGGDRLVVTRRSRGLAGRVISAVWLVSGIAFVLIGVLEMLR